MRWRFSRRLRHFLDALVDIDILASRAHPGFQLCGLGSRPIGFHRRANLVEHVGMRLSILRIEPGMSKGHGAIQDYPTRILAPLIRPYLGLQRCNLIFGLLRSAFRFRQPLVCRLPGF
jgi:hypothetical protein